MTNYIKKLKSKFSIATRVYGKRARNFFSKPTVIFFYHRVATVETDPHLLSVSPKNFEKQLTYLKENFRIIRLSQLVSDIKKNKIARGSAVITFDDGYADNLTAALPILEKFQVPATIFIIAGKIGSSEPFYWDNKTDKKDQGRALTEAELKELAKNPLIEIGSHTMTHPHLPALSSNRHGYEIDESKKVLENILGKPVIFFSYPFGDFDSATMQIAEQAGFQSACATSKENIRNDSPLFALPRRVVRDWDIPRFKQFLRNL